MHKEKYGKGSGGVLINIEKNVFQNEPWGFQKGNENLGFHIRENKNVLY